MRLWTIKSRFLWVLKENIRARHFYERLGFSLTDKFIIISVIKICEKSNISTQFAKSALCQEVAESKNR